MQFPRADFSDYRQDFGIEDKLKGYTEKLGDFYSLHLPQFWIFTTPDPNGPERKILADAQPPLRIFDLRTDSPLWQN